MIQLGVIAVCVAYVAVVGRGHPLLVLFFVIEGLLAAKGLAFGRVMLDVPLTLALAPMVVWTTDPPSLERGVLAKLYRGAIVLVAVVVFVAFMVLATAHIVDEWRLRGPSSIDFPVWVPVCLLLWNLVAVALLAQQQWARPGEAA